MISEVCSCSRLSWIRQSDWKNRLQGPCHRFNLYIWIISSPGSNWRERISKLLEDEYATCTYHGIVSRSHVAHTNIYISLVLAVEPHLTPPGIAMHPHPLVFHFTPPPQDYVLGMSWLFMRLCQCSTRSGTSSFSFFLFPYSFSIFIVDFFLLLTLSFFSSVFFCRAKSTLLTEYGGGHLVGYLFVAPEHDI